MGALTPGVDGVHAPKRARAAVGLNMEFHMTKGADVAAKIIEHVPNRSLAFLDSRGTKSRWVCVPTSGGTLLTNEILGHFGPDRAAKLESEAMDRLRDFVQANLSKGT